MLLYVAIVRLTWEDRKFGAAFIAHA